MTDTDKRAALIAGLRELADWYVFHPDAPLPAFPAFVHCVSCDNDAAGLAEIEAIAGALGVEGSEYGTRPAAQRNFGAIEFRAYYVPRSDMADYNADQKLLAKVKAEQDAQSGPRVWNAGDPEPGPEVTAVFDRDSVGDGPPLFRWWRTPNGWQWEESRAKADAQTGAGAPWSTLLSLAPVVDATLAAEADPAA